MTLCTKYSEMTDWCAWLLFAQFMYQKYYHQLISRSIDFLIDNVQTFRKSPANGEENYLLYVLGWKILRERGERNWSRYLYMVNFLLDLCITSTTNDCCDDRYSIGLIVPTG